MDPSTTVRDDLGRRTLHLEGRLHAGALLRQRFLVQEGVLLPEATFLKAPRQRLEAWVTDIPAHASWRS